MSMTRTIKRGILRNQVGNKALRSAWRRLRGIHPDEVVHQPKPSIFKRLKVALRRMVSLSRKENRK